MTIRIAAIEVSHWHALNDAAYLRHLVAMPDVELVAIQDSDPVSSRDEQPRWGARRPSRITERCWPRPAPTSSWHSGGTGRWPRSRTTCSIRAIRS